MSGTDMSVFRDAVKRGTVELDVGGLAGNYTVPADKAGAALIRLTGAVGASFGILLPAVAGMEWTLDLTSLTSSVGEGSIFVGSGATGVSALIGYTSKFQVPHSGTGMRGFAGPSTFSGGSAVTVASAATDTLTTAESKAQVIELAGGNQATEITLTADTLGPGSLTAFLINNNRGFASTLKAPNDEGSGVTIAANRRAWIMIDSGGEMVRVTPDQA